MKKEQLKKIKELVAKNGTAYALIGCSAEVKSAKELDNNEYLYDSNQFVIGVYETEKDGIKDYELNARVYRSNGGYNFLSANFGRVVWICQEDLDEAEKYDEEFDPCVITEGSGLLCEEEIRKMLKEM